MSLCLWNTVSRQNSHSTLLWLAGTDLYWRLASTVTLLFGPSCSRQIFSLSLLVSQPPWGLLRLLSVYHKMTCSPCAGAMLLFSDHVAAGGFSPSRLSAARWRYVLTVTACVYKLVTIDTDVFHWFLFSSSPPHHNKRTPSKL